MSTGNKKAFSPQFERDYFFYLSNKDKFNFGGSDVKADFGIQYQGEPDQVVQDGGKDLIVPFRIPFSVVGESAKTCFFQLDSNGKSVPCLEPVLLVEILRCKSSINLNIKIWAQSRAEYTLSKGEIQEYMKEINAPDWVFKAIENQKQRILDNWISDKKYQSKFYCQAFALHMVEVLIESGDWI